MIIAFGNKARQGKDTCCEAIQNWYGSKKVVRINFADALRREVTSAIDLSGGLTNFFDEWRAKGMPDWVKPDLKPIMSDPLLPHGKHPLLLQWWGSQFRREQNPNYWVDQWMLAVDKEDRIVVCSDARFLNEARKVREIGGTLVNVSRVNPDGTPYFATDRNPMHQSEIDLDGFNWDYYLKAASGQAAFLEQQAITLAEFLKGLQSGS